MIGCKNKTLGDTFLIHFSYSQFNASKCNLNIIFTKQQPFGHSSPLLKCIKFIKVPDLVTLYKAMFI